MTYDVTSFSISFNALSIFGKKEKKKLLLVEILSE